METWDGWLKWLRDALQLPEAGISLVSPAPFPDNPISVGVCPDETVTFDAGASVPGAPEFPVDSLIWNWGDGTVETTAASDGFQLGHSYSEPGEYIVTLVVQDVNNCNSTNLLPHQVLVSTIPIFNTEISTPLCEDAPGFLNGNPVQSITWTALPPWGFLNWRTFRMRQGWRSRPSCSSTSLTPIRCSRIATTLS